MDPPDEMGESTQSVADRRLIVDMWSSATNWLALAHEPKRSVLSCALVPLEWVDII
jgi:hypothetical protein